MATCDSSAAKEMLQSWESRQQSKDSCRRTYVQEGSRRMQKRRRLLAPIVGPCRAGGALYEASARRSNVHRSADEDNRKVTAKGTNGRWPGRRRHSAQ
jgi:hypothetical protein